MTTAAKAWRAAAAAARAGRPIAWLMYVHGGYWSHGDYRLGTATCTDEARHGRACFSVEYRLVPKVTWPAPLQDVRADLAWIRQNGARFGLAPKRGYLCGTSAGGLMASIVGLGDRRLKGVVIDSGVTDALVAATDPTQGQNPRTRRNTLRLFGEQRPAQDPALWRSARAVSYMSRGGRHVPFYVEHGTSDVTIYPQMSDRLVAELRRHGYPVEYHRMSGYTHYDIGAAGLVLMDRWIAGLGD